MNTLISIEYNELDEKLKKEVRENFLNDPYLLPDDWDDDIMYYLEEKYKNEINFTPETMYFDLNTNTFDLSGNVELGNTTIEKMIPEKYFEYSEKDWFYSVGTEFVNGEMLKDFELDELNIQLYIEQDVFIYDLSNDFTDGKLSIDINKYKPVFEKALNKYGHYSDKVVSILKKLLETMTASEFFFQSTIELSGEDYDQVTGILINKLIDEINTFMENEFYDKIEEFVSEVYEEFKSNVKGNYNYYFSDEFADVSLDGRIFEVIIDEEGNQQEIVDLDGE